MVHHRVTRAAHVIKNFEHQKRNMKDSFVSSNKSTRGTELTPRRLVRRVRCQVVLERLTLSLKHLALYHTRVSQGTSSERKATQYL